MQIHDQTAGPQNPFVPDCIASHDIPQKQFDPDKDGRFEHSTKLLDWLASHVPPNFEHMVNPDWETPMLERLYDDADRQAAHEYRRLARFIQQQRPLAQVGLYQIAPRRRWRVADCTSEWSKSAWRVIRWLRPAILVPNGYQQNPNSFAALPVVLQLAKSIGDRYGLPVYCQLMPQYHNNGGKGEYALQFPTDDEWREQLQIVKDAGCEGAIIWHRHWYYIRTWFKRTPGGEYVKNNVTPSGDPIDDMRRNAYRDWFNLDRESDITASESDERAAEITRHYLDIALEVAG